MKNNDNLFLSEEELLFMPKGAKNSYESFLWKWRIFWAKIFANIGRFFYRTVGRHCQKFGTKVKIKAKPILKYGHKIHGKLTAILENSYVHKKAHRLFEKSKIDLDVHLHVGQRLIKAMTKFLSDVLFVSSFLGLVGFYIVQKINISQKNRFVKGFLTFLGLIVGIFTMWVPLIYMLIVGIVKFIGHLIDFIGGIFTGENLRAYLYLAPALLVLLIFTFYPIVNSVLLSFKEGYKFNRPWEFTYSIQPYLMVLRDKVFHQALINTFIIVFVTVPLSVIIALLISVALNSIKRFKSLFQFFFFLPYITNILAIGLVFSVIFSRDNGIVNYVLVNVFNMNPIDWFGSRGSYLVTMVGLTIYIVWNSLAFKIMLMLSSMQGIDKQYYDAAKIDGASKYRTVRKITIPLISPIIFYLTITSVIAAFKSYAAIIAVFNNGDNMGPGNNPNKMITIVGYIFKLMDDRILPNTYPKASAAAVIMVIIILLFTLIQAKISSKRVHY